MVDKHGEMNRPPQQRLQRVLYDSIPIMPPNVQTSVWRQQPGVSDRLLHSGVAPPLQACNHCMNTGGMFGKTLMPNSVPQSVNTAWTLSCANHSDPKNCRRLVSGSMPVMMQYMPPNNSRPCAGLKSNVVDLYRSGVDWHSRAIIIP